MKTKASTFLILGILVIAGAVVWYWYSQKQAKARSIDNTTKITPGITTETPPLTNVIPGARTLTPTAVPMLIHKPIRHFTAQPKKIDLSKYF